MTFQTYNLFDLCWYMWINELPVIWILASVDACLRSCDGAAACHWERAPVALFQARAQGVSAYGSGRWHERALLAPFRPLTARATHHEIGVARGHTASSRKIRRLLNRGTVTSICPWILRAVSPKVARLFIELNWFLVSLIVDF